MLPFTQVGLAHFPLFPSSRMCSRSGRNNDHQAGDWTMSSWPKDVLQKIAESDDLHISPFREDGVTYGTPTWIWSVVVDDALNVRAYNGPASRWYQAAMQQKRGRIT